MATLATNATCLPSLDGNPTRSVHDIVATCYSTMVICVWHAVHLDIPTRKQGPVRGAVLKLLWILLGLLMPDLLLFTAICQGAAAIVVLRSAYEHLTDMPPPPDGWLYRRVLLRGMGLRSYQTLDSLPPQAGESSDEESDSASGSMDFKSRRSHPWTLAHAFYAVMGGFVIDTSEPLSSYGTQSRFVLTPRGVQVLMRDAPGLVPDISLDALEDRSKSNGLTKAVLVVQVLYFCASCIVRSAASLPLSLLEVTTLAHALCTLLTYAAWWTKPLSINEPTIVTGPADELREIAATLLMDSPACMELPGGIFHFTYGCENNFVRATKTLPSNHTLVTPPGDGEHLTLGRDQSVNVEGMFYSLSPNDDPHPPWKRYLVFGWTGQPWYTALRGSSSGAALRRRDVLRWTLRERARCRLGDAAFSLELKKSHLAGYIQPGTHLGGVSNWDVVFHNYFLLVVCTACSALYGLPHVLGWNAAFASAAERTLWRMASVTLALIPVILVASLPAVFFIIILFLFSVGLYTNIIPDSVFKSILEPDDGGGDSVLPNHIPVLFHIVVPFGFILYLLSGGYLLVMNIIQLGGLLEGVREQPAILVG